MPALIPRACRKRGCPGTTTDRSGYCEQHRNEGWQQHQQGKSRHERGYGGKWDIKRARILKRDNHLCQNCLRTGRAVAATTVDHIKAKAHGGNGTNRGNYQRIPNWAGTVFEILPATTYNEGLLVSNSTDFTAISNQAKLMTCAYVGTVTVNGSMALPVSGIPFGKWNNNNVSVGFDGTNIIVRDISYSGRDDVSASVTMDLVIFNNTAPVAGDGITMTNSAGQVTFSTVKRPFVFDQQLTMTDSNQYVGDKYCQIVFTGAQSRRVDGYFNVRKKGVVMSGGNVRSAYNQVVGNYNDNGFDMSFNQNINMPVLILPNMY